MEKIFQCSDYRYREIERKKHNENEENTLHFVYTEMDVGKFIFKCRKSDRAWTKVKVDDMIFFLNRPTMSSSTPPPTICKELYYT